MALAKVVFTFQRGEPLVIGRRVLSGDPAGFTVEAVLKRSVGQVVPPASTPVAASFSAAFVAAAGAEPAHWLLTISALTSAALAAGHYAVDCRFLLAGQVAEISDPAFITLIESVSG